MAKSGDEEDESIWQKMIKESLDKESIPESHLVLLGDKESGK
jgi:hypothetical protein